MELVEIAPVVLFSVLAFWKPNAILFMLAAGTSLMLGFYWYDTYVTNLGLTMGLALRAFGFYCVGLAFRMLFWREPKGE